MFYADFNAQFFQIRIPPELWKIFWQVYVIFPSLFAEYVSGIMHLRSRKFGPLCINVIGEFTGQLSASAHGLHISHRIHPNRLDANRPADYDSQQSRCRSRGNDCRRTFFQQECQNIE